MWKSRTAYTGYQTASSLTSWMIEATYASPCAPDKQWEKEASGYSRTSECTLIHAHSHTCTHTMNKHPSNVKCWKLCSRANRYPPTEAGRSCSTSQGQWHTSAWIITLSHSASRQWITSCTEMSTGGGGRRQKEEAKETWRKARDAEENEQHTLFYALSVCCVLCRLYFWSFFLCVWVCARTLTFNITSL